MSRSAVQPLNTFAINEPRLELTNERSFVIVRGGQTITYNPYPSTSFNNSGFTFNTNPPSKQTVLDRIAIIKVPVTLTFNQDPLNPNVDNILQPGRDSLRSYPLSSVTDTLTSIINGFPVSVELKDIVHVMSRFHEKLDLRETFSSLLPFMDDNYQEYSNGDGANNNVLGTYVDTGSAGLIPRGAYPYLNTTNGLVAPFVNTPAQAVINTFITEYVILPPYLWDGTEAGGLYHLDTLQFKWILNSNLEHMWSHSTASTSTIGSINVQFAQPVMLLGWITPRLTAISSIPKTIAYPYFQISKYYTQNQLLVPPYPLVGSTVDIPSNVIQLQSIPRKLYIFARKSDNDVYADVTSRITSTDTFVKINKLNISWDNLDGVLSGASPEQLYVFSQNNGMNLSYPEWSGQTQIPSSVAGELTKVVGTVGGIVCIEMGKDLGLRDNQAEGINGQFNLQVKLNITNVSSAAMHVDLYILAVYDGVLHIEGNSAFAEIGVISESDVLNAPTRHDISYKMIEKIYGGANFFSRFKDVAGKTLDFLRSSKAISKSLGAIPHPIAQVGSKVAEAFGLGGCEMCGDPNHRCMCGVRSGARAGVRAGVLYGGANANRNDMRRRLMEV